MDRIVIARIIIGSIVGVVLLTAFGTWFSSKVCQIRDQHQRRLS